MSGGAESTHGSPDAGVDDPCVGRDVEADDLHDVGDRDELRTRYYSLLQENRVLLPGVQILVAFLVTVPFNQRFEELDGGGQRAWLAALVVGCLAIICLMSPIVFHRVGNRTSRSARLVWGIRTQRAGITAFACSLLVSVLFVARFVSGTTATVTVIAVLLVGMAYLWLLVPMRDARQ
jgi:MFS family permease